MLKEITIKNYKSIVDDKISLGRINVFIGENGCGKSNIVEALAFASATFENNKVDAEALYNKGVRVAKPFLTFSSYYGKQQPAEISINLKYDLGNVLCTIKPDDKEDIFTKWSNTSLDSLMINEINSTKGTEFLEVTLKSINDVLQDYGKFDNKGLENLNSKYLLDKEKLLSQLEDRFKNKFTNLSPLSPFIDEFKDYLIYCINTNTLRGIPAFQESRKEPLGINGENLDILIANLSKDELTKLKSYSYLVSWLDNFKIDNEDLLKNRGYKINRSKSTLYFTDKFMMKKNNIFSSENANEGILHILFYLTLIISKKTPKIFAIDNIESSLNPHLCRELIKKIIVLAKEENKQVLITTHNPAVLDGLNLSDDDVRLFEVFRNNDGYTKSRRIQFKTESKPDNLKLSELWMKGYLGAISKKF